MRRLILTVAAAVALAAATVPGAASEAEAAVVDFTITVDGSPAHGIYALPTGAPAAVVVFGHGLGHTVDSWRHHVAAAAANGAVAVAMDYSPFFDLDRGGAETLAAARHFAEQYPGVPVIAFGVSMGGATTGIAVADGDGLFDYWFDVEGVANLFETYAEATAVGHPVAGYIEDDTGGTPLEVPEEYVARSAALRADDLASLKGAVLVHAVNDGLVPYNQGREMAAALAANGVPLESTTVVRGACSEQGTTGTNALLGRVPVDNNPLCLAGHATETSTTHPVMRVALDRLFGMLAGDAGPALYDEFVVDAPAQ